MLPKLRIILAAVFATCAAVLALSAGMLGTRDPDNDLNGVPEVSRTLVRQAIVAEPERQFQLLAYSRRADELLRLRDLPVTPARAVVEYAEHAQARAADTASAPAAMPPADAPPAPAADSAAVASPPTDTLPPAAVAMAAVANPAGDTTAATPVAQPASPPPAPSATTAAVAAPADTGSATAIAGAPADLPAVEVPTVVAPADTAAAPAPTAAPADIPVAAAPAASGDTKVAAVATGGSETAETFGPQKKPKTEGKPRHRAKIVRPHPPKPKKKTPVAVGNPRGPPSTGFAINQPDNRNNAFGGWRATNESTAR